MLKAIRYAFATICFALSVACFALWGASYYRQYAVTVPIDGKPLQVRLIVHRGEGQASALRVLGEWKYSSHKISSAYAFRTYPGLLMGRFARWGHSVTFPFWYPALVFALAGIGALRLGCRFTIRSAIIATTVIAALLGMVIAL